MKLTVRTVHHADPARSPSRGIPAALIFFLSLRVKWQKPNHPRTTGNVRKGLNILRSSRGAPRFHEALTVRVDLRPVVCHAAPGSVRVATEEDTTRSTLPLYGHSFCSLVTAEASKTRAPPAPNSSTERPADITRLTVCLGCIVADADRPEKDFPRPGNWRTSGNNRARTTASEERNENTRKAQQACQECRP